MHHTILAPAPYRFAPPQIAGCLLWLAADRIVGLNDADAVATWRDLSGNGRDATQPTVAKRPTYRTAVIAGKPVIRFDGVDDLLELPAELDAATLFLVFGNWVTNAPNNSHVIGGKITNEVLYTDSAGHWTVFSTAATPNQIIQTTASPPTNGFQIVTLHSDGATLSLAIDGATVGSGATGIALTIQQIAQYNNATTSTFTHADIAEIVAYSGILLAAERQRVQRYLGRKYNVAVS